MHEICTEDFRNFPQLALVRTTMALEGLLPFGEEYTSMLVSSVKTKFDLAGTQTFQRDIVPPSSGLTLAEKTFKLRPIHLSRLTV